MVVLGIDPGLAITGWCVINTGKIVSYGAIKTNSKDTHYERLKKIFVELRKIIKTYNPDKVVIEKLFFSKNRKTALKVAEARGVALLAIGSLPTKEYTPNEMKKMITGNGRATKKDISEKMKELLGLTYLPSLDDITDAIALSYLGEPD